MSAIWYYVQGSDSLGPVSMDDLASLYHEKTLSTDSYVWKKGFDSWKKIKEVDEVYTYIQSHDPSSDTVEPNVEEINIPKPIHSEISWDQLPRDKRILMIKTGADRGGDEAEYGPFSLEMLLRLYEEKRINGKTLVFTNGMENWSYLCDLEIYNSYFSGEPLEDLTGERRLNLRKPFVARMFFHDNEDLYEGICRDISIGGMQILVSDFPASVGDSISLNVHPENSDYRFVASGVIVRKLEGNQGFSFRFSGLTNEAKQAINDYIEKEIK